jgi:hypothetical protein
MREPHRSVRDTNARPDRLERAIVSVLSEIARILIDAGVTPDALDELSRVAFVEAASELCRLRNGRVNESRVAVLTGLSRQEVARIRRLPSRKISSGSTARSQRIIEGWRTDRRFLSRSGEPAPLRLGGFDATFTNLVKLHGGDVPAMAALEELKRLDAVRISRGTVRLLKTERRNFAKTSNRFCTSADRMAFAIRALSVPDSSSSMQSYDETIPVKDGLELQMLDRRIRSALSAAFRGIRALKSSRIRRSRAIRGSMKIRVLAAVTPLRNR